MATYGSFETVAELHRTGLGSVWSARRPGGEPVFAVKLCEPDTLIYGREAAAGAVATFLEQAETQRKAGGEAWAPVHESGVQPSGAYLVTDLFSRSLDRLIAGRYRFDGPTLHRLASAVVRGLRDIERNCGRGHGNLKASNVLIEASTGVPLARAVLCDPASDAKARANPGADTRALGALIYQCVMHQPFREVGAYPVPESKPWAALGGAGRTWLAMVNRLLDPQPQGAPPTLEQAAAEIEEAGRVKGRKPGPLIAGAAAALLVVGIGGYFALGGGEKEVIETPDVAEWPPGADAEWREFCVAYAAWGGRLIAALDQSVGPQLGGGPRRAVYAGDADLAALVKQLDEAKADGPTDPLGIAGLERGDLYSLGNNAPESVRKRRPLARFRRVLEALQTAEAMIGGEWGKARSLKGQAEEWRTHGWEGAAAGLESVIQPSEPSASMDVAEAMDRVLVAGQVVGEAQSRETEVQKLAQDLAATNDPVLTRFGDWANAVGTEGSPATGLDAVKELDARLGDAAATGRQLTAFLGGAWSGVDRQFLAEESPVYKEVAGTPSKELFERWLAEAANPKYAVPDREHDPTAGWRGETRLAEVRAQVQRLAGLNEPAGEAIVAEVDRLSKLVEQVKALEWTRRNVEQKTTLAAAVQGDLDKVWGELSRKVTEVTVGRAESAAAAKAELAQKSEVVPNSAAINRVWAAWRDAYVASITEQNYTEVPTRARRAEEALVKFNQALPSGLTGIDSGRAWTTRLGQVVAAERETRASAALEKYRGSPPADAEAVGASLTSEALAYAEWVRAVESLVTEAAALEDLLNDGYGLGEPPLNGGKTVGERAEGIAAMPGFGAVSAELDPVLERVEALRGIAGMSTAAALAAVLAPGATSRPEPVIAAWRRLGELPGWPATLADLRQGLEHRRRVSVVAGLIPNAARKQSVGEALEAESVDVWRRGFASLRIAADVEAAVGLMSDYGVVREGVTDPRLAYNLLVYDLKQAVAPRGGAAPDDPRVVEVGAAFLTHARALGSAIEQQAKVSPLLAELDPIVSGTEAPPPPFDPNAIGPGLAGWTGQKVGDSIDHLRYTKAGRDGPLTIEFRRVEPTEGVPEPVYVGTTEVPVGMFLEIGGQALDSLLATRPFEGPSVWSRSSGSLGVAPAWLEAQRDRLSGRYSDISASPAGLDPGRPTPETPAQQVSPAAALLVCRLMGCRLPTPDEWRGAYQAAAQAAALSEWNLRDQSWGRQHAHVQSVVQMLMGRGDAKTDVLDWPDMGVFARGAHPDAAEAVARAEDDGVVWFRPVTLEAEHPFRNLVGNVAEFVFADAEAAESAAATPEGAAAAARAGGDKFAVIGGSALSAPTIPIDQPMPVDRFDVEDMLGFSDVGFRPAFSAGGTSSRETYAARVSRVLTADPYLYP